ncbi:hypothetical protein PBI_VANISOA_37 [Mycobacterium phage Vanisoa]|nr:hypothetical protein PBI_VANISOA_37 [Mycobacterium phage Vanisoa]
MPTWIRRLLKRNPDRYPEWRPDQMLTPENRSMTGTHEGRFMHPQPYVRDRVRALQEWNERQDEWEASLLASGWAFAGFDAYGSKVWTRHCSNPPR